MAIDQIDEETNIDLSRLQRQTLERYLGHCIDIGEDAVAEEVRAAMALQDATEREDIAA
jgi:hypothetical protein